MNILPNEKRVQVISALVEGNSMRSISRMTGVARNTINTLLIDVGNACADFHHRTMRKLNCKRLECDEIWAFVGMKQKNVPAEKIGRGVGDVWTWTAIDAQTKLIPSWLVGSRDAESAKQFMHDLAGRLAHRVQITTDGHKSYIEAVDEAFADEVDFAQLVKMYGNEVNPGEARYSPAAVTGIQKTTIMGKPDHKLVSTSYVERQNLTMRMSMRRFTRLTNAFSKKLENLVHSVALHFMHYNFCRVHGTLKATPAMAAGLTPRPATIQDIVDMLE